MKLTIRILALIALFISCAWFYHEQDFEPALAIVVSFSTLISTFLFSKKDNSKTVQRQKVSDKSTAFQAGGDVTITLNNNTTKESNAR